ncbi:MAG: sigma-54 dependent transcriptional regulator [bacterium]
MARILLVDDEPSILNVLSTLLKQEGHETVPVRGGEKAQDILRNEQFDLMISDIRMSPIDGMQLLIQAHKEKPGMAVIMLTAYGSVETAVEAMKQGAFDYVTKPFKVDELLITVERALQYRNVLAENVQLKQQLESRYRFENIVAESLTMRKVCEMIERVAPTDTTILILGESGTGKELVAKAIHAHSTRKNKNFLPINCAALPEPLLESEMFGHVKGAFTGATSNKDGLFEAAAGGTIFLDEIGTMPLSIQAKLLRVLQDRQVRKVGSNESVAIDVRVLAATNDRLERLIGEGKFREDLYYRLSVIPIEVGPLRERPEDIMPLVYHFVRRIMGEGKEMPTIEADAQIILEKYSWPGNVRELENAMRHALTFARDNKIMRADLPAKMVAIVGSGGALATSPGTRPEDFRGKSLKSFLRAKEKEFLSQVLTNMEGDKEKTAKALKISLATLYRKLPDPQE